MRLTKHRKQLLDLFKQDRENLYNAEMLYEKLDGQMNLATIYRALDLFQKEGVIAKSIIEGSAYYYYMENMHYHYMICLNCHTKIKIDCLVHQTIDTIASKNDFQVQQHDLTVYGYCKDCKL